MRRSDLFPPRPHSGIEIGPEGLGFLAKIGIFGGATWSFFLLASGKIRESFLVTTVYVPACMLLTWGATAAAMASQDHGFQSLADSTDQLVAGLKTALGDNGRSGTDLHRNELRAELEERLKDMKAVLGYMHDIRTRWTALPVLGLLPICAGRIRRDEERYHALKSLAKPHSQEVVV